MLTFWRLRGEDNSEAELAVTFSASDAAFLYIQAAHTSLSPQLTRSPFCSTAYEKNKHVISVGFAFNQQINRIKEEETSAF